MYNRELRGKADLAEATFNRQIKVQEAEAQRESARALAIRDSVQALGEAVATRIRADASSNQIRTIGTALQNNEPYLRYMFLSVLPSGKTVYVPTEANLPILEARP